MTGTLPANGATGVCRNSLIQATFDQPMQISIFKDNVIVAGDYGTSQCPAGTKYLTAAYKPSFFAKIKSRLVKIPLVNKLLGADADASDIITGNFCTVSGTVSGYDN
ncbi:Ig-like domain-containing protein, partial [Rheinheimera sp.]|uniref:Ig-like domain-containing protein n=1 Tax=Rheinheimera sp. TaxID=1869214 RepID=UPI00273477B3